MVRKSVAKSNASLAQHGIQVSPCADSHLCCGSAGTYSILQSSLAQTLRDRKLNALQATTPDRIVSANIGCIAHLQSGTETPVEHWIVLLERRLSSATSAG
jgi:glycolate oxidase iron-sulfur subunit